MANSEALKAKIIDSFFRSGTKDIDTFVDSVTAGIKKIIEENIDTKTITSSSKSIQVLAENIMQHIVNCDAIIQEKGTSSKDKHEENKATIANKLADIANSHAEPRKDLIATPGKNK